MDNKQFKFILNKCFGEYGFVYKNKTYVFVDNKIGIVINLQKSDYANAYYVNYRFCVKALHDNILIPSTNDCDVMGRFRRVNEKKEEYIFELDMLNEDILRGDIEKCINEIILPVIEGGIVKYFEMYPDAIYAARPCLRAYLGL